jgi:hypothetical protein
MHSGASFVEARGGSAMSDAQKKAVKMTTEEVIDKLFPKRAVRTARRFVDQSNARTKRSSRAVGR